MSSKNNLYSGLSEIAGIYDHLNGNLLDSFNKTELDTVGFKIPDKIIKEFKIKMKKFNIRSKSFSPKITSEKDFRDYAHVVMKKAHGESYDVDITNKVVDDLIKDNPDANYGELIGRLTSGFGDKSFADNESVVKCVTTNPTQLLKILNAIKEHGNPGHSFEIIIDAGNENEEKFSWDGDGADRIETIETDGAKLYSKSDKAFGIKDNLKKWTVESLAELAYDIIEDNKLIQEAFKGYKGNSADDLKKFMKQYHIGVVDALATLAVILEFGWKADQKNYSEMTVDNDPSILNQEKSNLNPSVSNSDGMNINWSVQNPFNLSIEPWLVANVINGKSDGLYVGSLLGDSIDLGSDHLSLDIKLGNSQPTEVFVIVREGKAIIFKSSQLSKKNKSFSIGNYDYRFSIVPTETSYEMQYLIGSWMMASSICHLYHICDNKYAGHVALDEFYKEFPEKIDALAEHFLADNDKAEFRVCVIPGQCPIDYLTRLLQFTLKYVELNEGKIPSSYQSQLDEIVCFTQSILYKLKRLDSGRRIFSIKK